jgi:YD repeat-containing protein
MRKITTILILLFWKIGFGQNPEIKSSLPTIIPPSPTVSALMKFEEVAVSNYTGVPDISIPLFSSATLSKDIGINIALKYHSGVGANDRASDVGLGWSLIAGGSISRTVRGLPDEQIQLDANRTSGKVGLYHTSLLNHNNFYYQHSDNMLQFIISNPYQADEYLWDIVERNKFDTEHDLWQFNFMGYSGRFYIKKNLQTNLLEVKPLDDYRLKIINNYSTVGINNYIPSGFTIYDEKGNKYIFEVFESTTNKTAISNSFVDNQSTSVSADKEFISAFHLSKIFDTNNNLVVEYIFNNNNEFKEHTVNSTITVNDYFSGNNSVVNALELMRSMNCFGEFKPLKSIVNSHSNVSVKKIKRIVINGYSKIDINYQKGRLDTNLLYAENAAFVDNIIIKNWSDELVKKIQFDYNYSYVIENRMILNKIFEIDANSNSNNQYEFFYKKKELFGNIPSKDYWGYFNLTPSCYNKDIAFSNEPTPSFSTTDLIQKIKYPTGGCTIFDFEANRYSFIGDVALSNFEENPEMYQLINSTTLTFSSSAIQLLPISTLENRKVKFYPSLVMNEDPNLNSRTFSLLEKENGVWVSKGGFICSLNNPNCCIDYVLLKDKEYAIRRDNVSLSNSGIDSIRIDYFTRNQTELNFLYGGGNRIKQIGYFDSDVPKEYYNESSNFSQFIPIKEKKYSYALPSNTNKSSGSLVFAKPLFKYEDAIKIKTICESEVFLGSAIPEIIGFETSTNFNNLNPLKTQGADVGYKYVSVKETGNGSTNYEYYSSIDFPEEILFSNTPPFLPSKNYDYKRGLILKEVIKNQNSLTLNEINYNYNFDDFEVKYGFKRYKPNGTCFGGNYFSDYSSYIQILQNNDVLVRTNNFNSIDKINLCGYPSVYSQQYFLYAAYGWAKLSSKSTSNYFYPNGASTPNVVTTNEIFSYNPLNKQIASHTVSDTLGEISTTNYFYHTGNSPTSQNRISEIERIETKKGTELLSESKINYSNTFAGNQSFLPSTIQVKKGQYPSEVRLRNNLYDEFGHVLEVEQDTGVKICYIYGYNKTQPIAKIENLAYSSIPGSTIENLQNKSNADNDSCSSVPCSGNEENLRVELNALRSAYPNAIITTYTYNPLIGVTSITDPKGDVVFYNYDSFGRLESVKDKEGNVLSENKYNYRPN